MSNSSNEGEFIAEIELIFGLEGYARWFKLLEAVALKMDLSDNCKASYPWPKWQAILKGKRNKLVSFLVHLEKQRQINLKETGNILEIEIPKLLILRDNHSKNLQVTCKQLASKKEEEEREEELEKKVEKKERRGESPTAPPAQAPPKKEKKEKTGTRLPEEWSPSADLREWAKTERPDLDILQTAQAFKDHWAAEAGAKGRKLDWDAAFRNWVRRERGFASRPGQSRPMHQRLNGNEIVPSDQRKGGIII